ncbi:hypothetical protein SAMN02745121_02917 [Nannocystis exedens]|uniref:Uncharacterized protein n=1 Tax=Nannocystis exedens TaxID=54 RepID=A0A1I1XK51_9BACT|nr:hypothetical protein [Nannocystis exedens]PCC73354.1 hypothetical protein NAEX_06442 [Nannocystis exedens]SFE07682.1 hypothetical protein SAMN02745121_02917 [Nannocystis exedens]
MQRLSPPSSFLASVFSFASAFALGCVITVGPGGDDAGIHDCGSLLANNDANCVCNPGYERCNPGTDDTDCCEKEGKGGECEPNSTLSGDQCFCDVGYTWCNPDDDADLTCCPDDGQTSQGTDGTATDSSTDGTTTEQIPTTSVGTTGEPEECLEAVEPPGTCNPDTESFFCTNPDTCGPYGSKQYYCEGGVWVEDTTLDDTCKLDGYDFSYGCVDDGMNIYTECGSGSGAACSGEAPSCLDANTWAGCKWGKTTEADCFTLCTEIGDDMGATYDFGSCEVQDGLAVCACCDEGEEGCPINETGTDTDTSSTGGDSTSSTG